MRQYMVCLTRFQKKIWAPSERSAKQQATKIAREHLGDLGEQGPWLQGGDADDPNWLKMCEPDYIVLETLF